MMTQPDPINSHIPNGNKKNTLTAELHHKNNSASVNLLPVRSYLSFMS